MNEQSSMFLGIDVSKAHLDCALLLGAKYRNKRVANNPCAVFQPPGILPHSAAGVFLP